MWYITYHDITYNIGSRARSAHRVGIRRHAGRLGRGAVFGGGGPPGRLPHAPRQGNDRAAPAPTTRTEGLSAARGRRTGVPVPGDGTVAQPGGPRGAADH